MSDEDIATQTAPDKPYRLKPLDRIQVLLPPEATLPMSERVYAMEPAIIDDPVAPTERDIELVERLGALMCEPTEVLAITGLTKDQFNHTFSAPWARGRERAKARLRLMQWDAAAMGSERMLVHLGKQYLDQTEKLEKNDLTEEQRQERRNFRDKLADTLDRARKSRVAELTHGRGDDSGEKGVAPVGEGQSTSTAS